MIRLIKGTDGQYWAINPEHVSAIEPQEHRRCLVRLRSGQNMSVPAPVDRLWEALTRFPAPGTAPNPVDLSGGNFLGELDDPVMEPG